MQRLRCVAGKDPKDVDWDKAWKSFDNQSKRKRSGGPSQPPPPGSTPDPAVRPPPPAPGIRLPTTAAIVIVVVRAQLQCSLGHVSLLALRTPPADCHPPTKPVPREPWLVERRAYVHTCSCLAPGSALPPCGGRRGGDVSAGVGGRCSRRSPSAAHSACARGGEPLHTRPGHDHATAECSCCTSFPYPSTCPPGAAAPSLSVPQGCITHAEGVEVQIDDIKRAENNLLNAWTSEAFTRNGLIAVVALLVFFLFVIGPPPSDGRCTLPWC